MYLIAGFLAGIGGTMLMTLFITSFSLVFKKSFFVVKILDVILVVSGTPQIGRLTTRYNLALIIHYGVGVIFSYVFLSLVTFGIVTFSFVEALIFGASIGALAVSAWMLLLNIYPFFVRTNKLWYLALIWFGHLLFAIGMFAIYQPLLEPKLFETITICK